MEFKIAQRRHGSRFRVDLFAEEFPELFTQAVICETFSR